jgi:predicted HD superfamily hydrolase involved in NAD metabolism
MLGSPFGAFRGTSVVGEDVRRFLISLGHPKTASHCAAVAARAKELAARFSADPAKAEQAGYLHDISAVIPDEKRIEFARSRRVEVLAEEALCPMILHQKLSAVLAREMFGVTDAAILGAVECHTTLKAGAALLDKVVFLADKIAWDQAGDPPYLDKVARGLGVSLDLAVLEYLNYLWERRSELKVIHPWFVAARDGLLGAGVRPLMTRLYETEQDLRHMQELLIAGRSQTDDWRYPHIGDLVFDFFMVVCHLDPAKHIHLWHDDGRLVGYAILGEDPVFDFQILPGYEWLGIELEALTWAETLLAELRQGDIERWGGDLVTSAHPDNAERIEFLEQHGFRRGGQFSEVNMLCSLAEPVPDLPLPVNYQVRSMAEAEDVPGRAAAHREVWHPWTVGEVSDDDYACFMRLPGYDPELDVVAVAADGAIAAYVNGWIDPINHVGDLGPVGARPAYRQQGLTRAVLLECLRRMRERGMERVTVSTGVTNPAARRLYESVGFRIVNEDHEYLKPAGR